MLDIQSLALLVATVWLACTIDVASIDERECRNVTTVVRGDDHYGVVCCNNGTTGYWKNGQITHSVSYLSYPCASAYPPDSKCRPNNCIVCVNNFQLAIFAGTSLLLWTSFVLTGFGYRKAMKKIVRLNQELDARHRTIDSLRGGIFNSALDGYDIVGAPLIALDDSGAGPADCQEDSATL